MTKHRRTSQRRRERGQGLVEMALVVLILVALSMMIVECGRLLMILNMITNATRDAARAAAVVNPGGRCVSNGHLTSSQQTNIGSMVKNQLANIGIPSTSVTVTVTQAVVNSVNTINVTTVVPVELISPFWRAAYDSSRTVTFRDEFQTGTVAGC